MKLALCYSRAVEGMRSLVLDVAASMLLQEKFKGKSLAEF